MSTLHPRPCDFWQRASRVGAALAAAACLALAGCAMPFGGRGGAKAADQARPEPREFAVGADLSFLGAAEASGTRFLDGGVEKPGLQIFKDHGYTWVRLRLFHTPGARDRPLPNDLAYTIEQARRAKATGFKLLLDFHYSDTWADPEHQITPEAWKSLTHAELVSAVRDYTRRCIVAFREAGAMPDLVQIGNEITAGMLWPDGKLPKRWDEFAELVRAGTQGAREGGAGAPPLKFLVQIERSGSWKETKWFFDHLFDRGVEADVLGQSYYPWWHGSLDELRTTLHGMAREYGRPVMVVEAAYCWRATEYGEGSKAVGPAPFPETPEGQRDFLAAVGEVVRGVPDGLGAGVFWWEPAVGLARGRNRLRARGMFDDVGNVLPVIDALAAPKGGRGGP